MVWHKLPYTNFHDLNEDWITRKIVELDDKVNNKLDDAINKYIDEHMTQFMLKVMYDEENTAIKFIGVFDDNGCVNNG